MKYTFSTNSTSPVQVVEAVDFSDELDYLGDVPVPGAKRIRRSGFYNKASRRPAGGAEDYSLKLASPVLVKLEDGTSAVASREGVRAYAGRTGQSVPEGF